MSLLPSAGDGLQSGPKHLVSCCPVTLPGLASPAHVAHQELRGGKPQPFRCPATVRQAGNHHRASMGAAPPALGSVSPSLPALCSVLSHTLCFIRVDTGAGWLCGGLS